MSDEIPKRGPGRPPLTGARFARMQINVPLDTRDALAVAAKGQRITVSELARRIFADWMRREISVRSTPQSGEETPRD